LDRKLNNAEFDAIVVGSGPGGATVARELSKRRKRVLILERGGNAPLKESLLATLSILNAVSVSDNLLVGSAFTTGGTTAVYFAATVPPPLETFLSLGIDLSRQLDDAQRELPLAALPDELLRPQSIRLRESATALGYEWLKSRMLVDQSKCASGYAHEAKWTARSYVQEAVAKGATLMNRARVLKILVEKNRAIGVEYQLQKAKKEFEIRRAFGTKIILAAGGAASPVILRSSGIKNVANKGFYCHPNFMVFGTIAGLKAGEGFGGSMGTVVDGDIHVGDANFASTLHRMIMLANRRWVRALLHSKSIGVGVMVREGLGGGIQEDGRYYKQLTKEDLRKLARGEEVARQIIQHAGGKRIAKSYLSAAHLGGTIRIKEHINENLETEHGNLHVCDGSVLPENVNTPTLTLICLGKYLASRLSCSL
jgi:choline dehydrogenase-like flavoprotein